MLKKTVAVICLALPICANAALYDRGSGLIYDDVLDITWLADANLASSNTFGLTIGENGWMFYNDEVEDYLAAVRLQPIRYQMT
jgi:hypothetical protein